MAQVYKDKPLNMSNSTNTRVIRIYSKSTANLHGKYTVACNIQVISVDDAIPYIAVSYMWGDPVCKQEILVDGKPFLVGSNLFDFLTMISESGYSQLFWIDALCINQDDTSERNHQVALMARIYASAKHVVVWLGKREEDDEVLQAMQTLTLWVQQQAGSHQDDPNDAQMVLKHANISILVSEPSYWNRAWIVQELILAKEFSIHCGSHSIPGARFIQWLEYVTLPSEEFKNAGMRSLRRVVDKSTPVQILRERKLWQSDTAHYIEPWQSYYRAECSDVRDRIYSMIAFMDPAKRIIPDYDRTRSQLFAYLVSHHLQRDDIDTFFKAVRALLGILELDEEDETVDKCLLEWVAEDHKFEYLPAGYFREKKVMLYTELSESMWVDRRTRFWQEEKLRMHRFLLARIFNIWSSSDGLLEKLVESEKRLECLEARSSQSLKVISRKLDVLQDTMFRHL